MWRGGSAVRPETEPLTEEMRIWHLFTHTSGLTYGFMQAHPVDALYRQAGFEWAVPDGLDLAGVCDRLADLPLLFQPGTGVELRHEHRRARHGRRGGVRHAVRRVRPAPRARPAGHGRHDVVRRPPSGPSASPRCTCRRPASGTVMRYDGMGAAALERPRPRWAAAGCARRPATTSASPTCCARRGELDGVRLLAPGTVDYMASNHLPGGADLSAFGRRLFSETTFDGVGFGLGVSVTLDPVKAKVPGSVGDYGWGGAASTNYWVDPVRTSASLFMTQLLPSDSLPLRSQLQPAGLRRPGRC